MKILKIALFSFIFAASFLVTTAPFSHAHRVNVFAYREGDVVHVEGYFVDGKPAVGAKVEVRGEKGNLVVSGKTDDSGRFSFEGGKSAKLDIILEASMGHRGMFHLAGGEGDGKVESDRVRAAYGSPGEREIEVAVERAVEKKLEPVISMLDEMRKRQERPGVKDVIAGIGYIFGIMGVILYVRAKRRG